MAMQLSDSQASVEISDSIDFIDRSSQLSCVHQPPRHHPLDHHHTLGALAV